MLHFLIILKLLHIVYMYSHYASYFPYLTRLTLYGLKISFLPFSMGYNYYYGGIPKAELELKSETKKKKED